MATARKGTKNKKIEQNTAAETLKAVDAMNLETVIDNVGKLQVELSTTLGNVTAELTTRIREKDQLDEAIDLKKEQLKTLHGIEVTATTLDEIQATKEEAEQALKKFEADSLATQAELTKRLRTEREREEKDYVYNRDLTRRKERDDYEAELAKAKREEAERAEILKKDWLKREHELQAKEQELVTLRAQAAAFPEELKKETEKKVAIATSAQKREYEHEKAIAAKDAENKLAIRDAQIASLEGTIAALREQIARIEAQLEAARSDAKDVTTKALESASGREVAAAYRQSVDTRDASAGKATRGAAS